MTNDREEEPLLLKILPEQVSERWEVFAPLIEKSLPPTVTQRRQRMANVLRAILMEDLVAWIYYDEKKRERYVVTTLIRTDEVSLSKNLLIYSFTSLGQLEPRHAVEGLEVLRDYAEGVGCTRVIAYSANDQIVEFLENLGASANYKLIQMEV